MSFLASVTASVRKTFKDTFVRSNTSGGPGRASDGSLWDATRGTMVVSSNTLTTTDAVSGYPMVTTDMGVENVQVEVSAANNGQMAALWVTDANNWWGIQTFSQATDCNCGSQAYSCNCGQQPYSCNCGSTPYSCGCGSVTTCGSYAGPYCLYYYTYYSCSTCYTYSCQTCYEYACQTCYQYVCQTCYPNNIRVMQAVSGTISAIYTWTIASLAAAFRVKTSGDQITVQAYSNADLTSQIGSDLTHNASSPTKTKRFGLSIGPSSYNQGTAISNVIIKRNP